MSKLSPRLEKFAQGVANGLSQAEAYRQAFQNSLNWKDATVWNKSSAIMRRGEVLARVDELRADLEKQALWSRMDSVATLKPIALAAEKDSDRIAAVKVLNEMHGYNAPIRTEVSGPNGGPMHTRSTADLTDEELAAEIAKFGIQ
jgi:hypothetical protein